MSDLRPITIYKSGVAVPISEQMRADIEIAQAIGDGVRAMLNTAMYDMAADAGVVPPRYRFPMRRQVEVYDDTYLAALSPAELLEEAQRLYGIIAEGDEGAYVAHLEWEYR